MPIKFRLRIKVSILESPWALFIKQWVLLSIMLVRIKKIRKNLKDFLNFQNHARFAMCKIQWHSRNSEIKINYSLY